jgi:predicted nucleic acid-binding protein
MRPRVFDANVPTYAAGLSIPSSLAARALGAAARGQIAAVTDAEALQEIMHRYASLERWEQGAEVVELSLRVLLDVLPITREEIVQALALYRARPGTDANRDWRQ